MTQGLLAGVDLGGTKILIGLFDHQGSLLGETLIPTRPASGFEAVADRIVQGVDQLRQENSPGRELLGLAVGAAAIIDPDQGLITESPNLKWREAPLAPRLQEALQVPVWIENDATLGALGEYVYGYPGEFEHMLYLTVSTGIGGGIIINGELYRGQDGGAGEFGHMIISPGGPECGCGRHGCLEALASGTAVARTARSQIEQGRGRAIREALQGNPDHIDARLVATVAANGDPEARRIMEEAIGCLGIGVANLVNIFNPQAIVIGGGLSRYEGLLARVEQVVRENAFRHLTGNLRILPARLGGRSGLMGALALAQRMLRGWRRIVE